MQSSSKFQHNSLQELKKKKRIINLLCKQEPSRIANTIWNNKRTTGGITIPDFKWNCQNIVKNSMHGLGIKTSLFDNRIEMKA